jgi:arylsulfatase A-like enzyme
VGIYGDFVMETDWVIGEVVKALEESGVLENSLIVVTSDNGCSPAARKDAGESPIHFNEGVSKPIDPNAHYPSLGFRGHKADIYEGGHRVPLVVRWDGIIKPNTRSDETICLTDFFATFAEMVGAKIPDNAGEDSVSLLSLLKGLEHAPLREATVHHSINGSFAIRQGDWKLELCPGSGGWSPPTPKKSLSDLPEGTPRIQLYNLKRDPSESQNLVEKYPEKVDKLTQLLEHYLQRGRSTPGTKQKNEGNTFLYPKWLRSSSSTIQQKNVTL